MREPMTPPADQQRSLDNLPLTREGLYAAFAHGRLYERAELRRAAVSGREIDDLPSVFGAHDDESMTFDVPKVGTDR